MAKEERPGFTCCDGQRAWSVQSPGHHLHVPATLGVKRGQRRRCAGRWQGVAVDVDARARRPAIEDDGELLVVDGCRGGRQCDGAEHLPVARVVLPAWRACWRGGGRSGT
eukprot:scaffold103039_cov45-Phaeocystis_antarctica.AAC.1